MMGLPIRIALVIALTLLPSIALIAQVEEEVRVELVEVYLSAVDKKQNAVEDLKASDFAVREDDRAREITHFTRLLAKDSDVPLTVIYLMDTSGSMAAGGVHQRRVDMARKFAEMTLQELKPGDKMQVVAFDIRYQLLTSWTSDISEINRALDLLNVEGNPGTAVLNAIKIAAEELKDQWGRKIIVLCSDGETDENDRKILDQVIPMLERYDIAVLALGTTEITEWHPLYFGRMAMPDGNQTRAYCQEQKIKVAGSTRGTPRGLDGANRGLSDDSRRAKARALLKKLAEETGGFVYFPTSQKKLDEVVDKMRSILRSQYMIGFPPSGAGMAPASGIQWHKIRVDCRRKGVKIRYRKGYYGGD
jgi:VWFA-related protein